MKYFLSTTDEVDCKELLETCLSLHKHLKWDKRRVLFYLGRESPPKFFSDYKRNTDEILSQWLKDISCNSRAKLIQVCRRFRCERTANKLLISDCRSMMDKPTH